MSPSRHAQLRQAARQLLAHSCKGAIAATLLLAGQCAWAGSVPDRIHSLADDFARAPRAPASLYDERGWLQRFYTARNYAPAWSGPGAPQATVAIELLRNAEEHGLPAAQYDPDGLATKMRAHGAVPADSVADIDTGLTLALLRYLADLHAGRIRSDLVPVAPDTRVLNFDPVKVLQAAMAENRLAAAIAAAEPQLPIYQRLKAALAQYRKLALRPQAPLAPLAAGQKTVEAGATYAGAQALAERLALLGDLQPEPLAAPNDSYTPPLAEAVKRFQDRHGLDADGKLGRQTLAALNVPLALRVRQIALSLERLRWLPDLSAGPFIAVNLPSFRLWAFHSAAADAQPVLAMRVIVGKALRTPTPLFVGALRYIEFNPYWNVPASIQHAEIVPALARDPDYLARNDMELVGAGDDHGQAVDAATLARLREGSVRVRQRPGPHNALGAVKFALPNAMNIYLHSTPARALFAQSRRDFSHGCIRVEDPLALARFVLGDQSSWPPEAVSTAMQPGASRTVQLKAPMPVLIFYTTAIIDRDGRAIFPADVYRLDDALERNLAAGGSARAW